MGHVWGRPSDANNTLKPHLGPICAPSHWSMWNTFTVPPWQLHVPRGQMSPCPNNAISSPKQLLAPKIEMNQVIDRSPIYVQDSPSPHRSVITISSSSDEGEKEDQAVAHCSLLAASRTKIEIPSPIDASGTSMQTSGIHSPSPVYPNALSAGMANFAQHLPSQQQHLQQHGSPQKTLMQHSVTSLIQPKTSPGNHRICCQQSQNAVGEVPANLCYLHVPVTVARMEQGTPDAALNSPTQGPQANHMYPFRRQGVSGLIPQLPSSQTAFSPVCAVVSTATTSPSRVQLLHPCFLSPGSNAYAHNPLIYPHLQAGIQTTQANEACAQTGYLMTPTISGLAQTHTCSSDNGIMRVGRHGQVHSSPYSSASLSPQRRVHHLGYPGSVLSHTSYQPVDPPSAYLAYTYYGPHRL